MAGSPGTDTYNPAGNTDASRKTVALVDGWHTPTAKSNQALPSMAKWPGSVAGAMGGWMTPRATDGEKSAGMSIERRKYKALDTLTDQAKTAGWATPATPAATDAKGSVTGETLERRRTMTRGVRLEEEARRYLPGQEPNGSTAQTAGRVGLNPAFSLWLQGYPIAWARCAARVMRSVRRSRPNSSAPIST